MSSHEHPPKIGETSRESLDFFKDALDSGAMSEPVTAQSFVDCGIELGKALELYNKLEVDEVIDTKGFVDKERLEELIEASPEQRELEREKTPEEIEREGTRKYFEELIQRRIVDDQLASGVTFHVGRGGTFRTDEFDKFYDTGRENMRSIIYNLRRCLKYVPADLHEFVIRLFPDGKLYPDGNSKVSVYADLTPKMIGLGLDTLKSENVENTKARISKLTEHLPKKPDNIEPTIEPSRSAERLFNSNLETFGKSFRSFEIDDAVRKDLINQGDGAVKNFFGQIFRVFGSVNSELLNRIDISMVDGEGIVAEPMEHRIVLGQLELSHEKIVETKRQVAEYIKEFFPAESVAPAVVEPIVAKPEPATAEATGPEVLPKPEVVVRPDPGPAVVSPAAITPSPTTKSPEVITPSLAHARKEYAEAYEEYLKENPLRKGQTLGLGGDMSTLQAARARYDVALEGAARNLRKAKLDELSQSDKKLSPEKIASEANREVFNELVISEEKRIADLKIMGAMSRKGEALPSERPNQWNRIWQAYVRMPRSRKILYSTLVGTGIAVATGGAVGLGAILLYAGRRAASPFLSAKAGALASGSLQATFGAYDRFTERGRKETKEYKIDALIEAQTEDIAENLDNMRLEYNTILQHQAEREKKRGYYKLAAAIVAGIATGAISSAATHAVTEAAHHIGSAPVSEIAHHGNHSLSAHLESSRNGHHASGSKPSATKPGGDVVSKGDLKLTPPPPSAEIPAAGAATHIEPIPLDESIPPPALPQHLEFHEPSVPTGSAAEHVVEIQKGDSVWKITANELNHDPEFTKLNEAQKTWVLSTLTNRALEHRNTVGFDNPNRLSLAAHTKLNLSEILKKDDVDKLIHRAGDLSDKKQSNILHNNSTIVNWLKEHPGKPLDEHQVEHILNPDHGSGNAATEFHENSGAALHSDQLVSNADVKIERPDHLEFVDRLDHPVPFIETQITPPAGSIKNAIGYWDGHDPKQALKIARDLEDTGRFSTGERASVLDALAHKMGVGRAAWKDINVANAAEVRERARDFLVSYPEAQRFGFDSYEKYMGLRDMAVSDVIRQIPAPGHWPRLVHHSYFRPGGQFRIIGTDGQWQRVPMTREQLQLGVALEKVAKETGDASGKTVSEMLASHRDVFEKNVASVKGTVTKALGHESRHWKGETN